MFSQLFVTSWDQVITRLPEVFLSRVGVAMWWMSHVARRFQCFSGHELMSTFQCNCSSHDTDLLNSEAMRTSDNQLIHNQQLIWVTRAEKRFTVFASADRSIPYTLVFITWYMQDPKVRSNATDHAIAYLLLVVLLVVQRPLSFRVTLYCITKSDSFRAFSIFFKMPKWSSYFCFLAALSSEGTTNLATFSSSLKFNIIMVAFDSVAFNSSRFAL